MRAFFNGLVLGIIFGAVAFWYIQKKANEHPQAEQRYEQAAAETASNATVTAHSISGGVAGQTGYARPEYEPGFLDQNWQTAPARWIVAKPSKSVTLAANAASDARAVTEIKAKYAMDSSLSVLEDFSESCNQGHVKLSGTVLVAAGYRQSHRSWRSTPTACAT